MLFNAAKVDIFTRPGESRGTDLLLEPSSSGTQRTSTLCYFHIGFIFQLWRFPLGWQKTPWVRIGSFFPGVSQARSVKLKSGEFLFHDNRQWCCH